MCSLEHAKHQDPHLRLVDKGVGTPELLSYGELGYVKVYSMPARHSCSPLSRIGFTGPKPVEAYHYPNGCGHDLLRAVVERVFQVRGADGGLVDPPRPTAPFSELTGNCLREFIGPYTATPAKLEDVPLMMNTGSKRRMYQRAVETLKDVPLMKKDVQMSSFVKIEPANHTRKGDPVPRLIQPRGVRYNALLARFLKPQEHHIYSRAAQLRWRRPTSTPVILKCYNQRERAAIIEEKFKAFVEPCAVMCDASRFDQHVSPEALAWEHQVYLAWFSHASESDKDELAKLLSMQLENTGHCRAKDGTYIRYVRKGCRMSGDMNTALGNCLLTTCLLYGLHKLLGIDMEVAVDGDDSVIIIERANLKALEDVIGCHFRRAGFTLVVEKAVFRLEHIDFCQCHPVFNGAHYIMCRNPSRALSTDLSGNRLWTDVRYLRDLHTSVGVGGGHLHVGIPILQAWYERVRRNGAGGQLNQQVFEQGYFQLAMQYIRDSKRSIPDVPMAKITAKARVSFYEAYGVLPNEQEAIEDYIAQLDFPLEGGEVDRDTTLAVWKERYDVVLNYSLSSVI